MELLQVLFSEIQCHPPKHLSLEQLNLGCQKEKGKKKKKENTSELLHGPEWKKG